MEFSDVLRQRRMVRHYLDQPVDPEVTDRVIAAGLRAPSAGFSQGFALLVLTSAEDRARFWEVTDTEPETASWPAETRAGVMRAPVIAIALWCTRIYLDRYAKDDKGWTDRVAARWPVPFWHMDAAMASLLILQTVVDEGLGACFFGIPPAHEADVRREFGIPEAFDPVGAITIGHPADREKPSGSPTTRRRKPMDDVVHRGSWGGH